MIYLLHFSQAYKHARHYLGYTAYDLEQRIEHHRKGMGARLTQVVSEAGITFDVVRTWQGGRTAERKLKDQHNGPRLCPVCNLKGISNHA